MAPIGEGPGTISGTTAPLHNAIVLEILPGVLLERIIVPEIVPGFLVDGLAVPDIVPGVPEVHRNQ